MVQRPTIRHFLALVVDNNFLEGEGRGSIKDLSRPFLSKKYAFYKQWAWQASKAATPLIFRNFNVHYQGFKMRYWLFLCDSWF